MDSPPIANSDEDLILASSHPKKRAGRKKFKETRHPVYRGVRQRNSNKWVCELREPNKQKRIWLGTYPTPEMAARAHDVAALALRGPMACLNFADSVWRLPAPVSKDAKDLRLAAVEAAEAFRPRANVLEEKEGEGSCGQGNNNNNNNNNNNINSNDDNNNNNNNNVFTSDFDYLSYTMGSGVLMSPPPCFGRSFSWDDDDDDDDVESDAEVELWNYTI